MTPLVIVSQIASILTIIGQGLLVIIIILALIPRVRNGAFGRFMSRNGTGFALIVALAAMTLSLMYSEVVGYEPCRLCWFQRIVIFPQVFLLGMAWIRNQGWLIKWYSIMIASIGIIISIRHYILQIVGGSANCGPEVVSCSAKYVFMYGYITIPMMALTAGLLIIAFLLWVKNNRS